jgi:hypothetical protein
MVIQKSGNVGIGETDPTAKLHIGGTPGVDGLMFPDGTLQTTASTGGGDSLWSESGSNIFYDAGNVGIGSTSAEHPLDVRNAASVATLNVENTSASSGTAIAATAQSGTGATAIRAETSSTNGYALYATNEAESGNAFGIYSKSMSPTGIAFRGHTSGPDGYGLYLTGGRHFIAGNVGIGTSSPQAKLHIGGTAGTDGIRFPDGTLQTTAATGGGDSVWSESGSDIFFTAGDVGIGTSNPTRDLHVVGTTLLDGHVGVGAAPVGNARLESTTTFTSGAAIAGIATATSGSARGIIATTSAPGGYGIEAIAPGAGVFGHTGTNGGVGVKGKFHSNEDDRNGYAVYGENTRDAGANYGVRGTSASPDGAGGLFSNSADGPAIYAFNAGSGASDATLRVLNTQYNAGMAAYFTNVSTYATAHLQNNGPGEVLWLSKDTTEGEFIVAHNEDTGGRVFQVDNDGWTKVSVLEITGGADLSEQFDVGAETDQVEPGMVVVIDTQHAGKLLLSTKAYDRTVAGIVSGAGGVKPGMLMGQQGTMADGKHPVALTGRVWTWCDATDGPIEPGDLLTTSATRGHAMKVTDHAKAQGAIIGKAMSSLTSGKGLVLVLVSLQ